MRSSVAALVGVGLIAVAASERASAQDQAHADGDRIVRNGYNELYGPPYSKTQMESIKILGVNLGMRWSEAERTIVSQGFTRNSKYGFMKLGKLGGSDFISFDVKTLKGARKRVTAVSYWRQVDLKTDQSRAAVREELLSVFGKPTTWYSPERGTNLVESLHWLTPDSIFDRDRRYEARVCGFSWECDYVLYQKDCRPRVKDAHGVSLEISVLHSANVLDYALYDMDIELKAARSSKRFWAMDVGQTVCLIPRVL